MYVVTTPRMRMRRLTSPAGEIVVDAPDRSRGHRKRVGRRFEDFDLACPAGEQRHAAHLGARAEERADVSSQPHPRIDEAILIDRLVVPERRPQDTLFERDVREQGMHIRIWRPPGSKHHADDLYVVAVVAAGEHRGVGNPLGRWQLRVADPTHCRRDNVRSEAAAHGTPFELDRIALLQVPPGGDWNLDLGRQHVLPESSVVHDESGVGLLVEVCDDAAHDDAIPLVGVVLRQGSNGLDGRQDFRGSAVNALRKPRCRGADEEG